VVVAVVAVVQGRLVPMPRLITVARVVLALNGRQVQQFIMVVVAVVRHLVALWEQVVLVVAVSAG
jgi:hypothetical protein